MEKWSTAKYLRPRIPKFERALYIGPRVIEHCMLITVLLNQFFHKWNKKTWSGSRVAINRQVRSFVHTDFVDSSKISRCTWLIFHEQNRSTFWQVSIELKFWTSWPWAIFAFLIVWHIVTYVFTKAIRVSRKNMINLDVVAKIPVVKKYSYPRRFHTLQFSAITQTVWLGYDKNWLLRSVTKFYPLLLAHSFYIL